MQPPKLPQSVRFAYAKQAPSPINWYTQEDYAGCLLTWLPPPKPVLGYIFVRTAEQLPESCVMDLMRGTYRGVVDQVLIKRPIDAMIDDQMHDRPRYLVLARTQDNEILPVEVKSEKLSIDRDIDELGRIGFWSNPDAPFGKGQDPRHLEYLPVRPGDFSGFSWSYPDHIPDLVKFHIIVSQQPVSAHTGTPEDIAQLRQVLQGKRGGLIQVEPFVTKLVDNATPPGQYHYFSLLACDSRGGRTQIPLEHHSTPFGPNVPLRYLLPVDGQLGQHPQQMQQAFMAWRTKMQAVIKAQQAIFQARMGIRPAQATPKPPPAQAAPAPKPEAPKPPPAQAAPAPKPEAPKPEAPKPEPKAPTPPPAREVPEPEPEPEAPTWAAVEPRDPPNLDSFLDDPSFLGVRLRWDDEGDEETRFVALRACAALDDALIPGLLRGERQDDRCDRVAFSGPVDTLMDIECHDRRWYCVAQITGDDTTPVTRLEARSLLRLPRSLRSTAYWSSPGEPLRGRQMPLMEAERIRQRGDAPVAIEFGTHDAVRSPKRVEIYHFNGRPDWQDDGVTQRDFIELQRSGESPLGRRFTIDASTGVRDDLMSSGANFIGAALVDERENRFAVSVFEAEPEDATGWLLLSTAAAEVEAPSLPDPTEFESPPLPDPIEFDAPSLPEPAEIPNLSHGIVLADGPPTVGEDLEDHIGLSTSDELSDLGYNAPPEFKDEALPDYEYVEGEPSENLPVDEEPSIEDATPSDPITGLVSIAQRVPKLTPEGSDVTWQRIEQTWYFNRLTWSPQQPPCGPLKLLWREITREAPPALHWDAFDAEEAIAGVRTLSVPAGATVMIDNLTEIAGWFVLVTRDETGAWRQVDIEQALPPWKSPRAPMLDPEGLARVDAQINEQIRIARRHLKTAPEQAKQALERAETIWPGSVRTLAFRQRHAL